MPSHLTHKKIKYHEVEAVSQKFQILGLLDIDYKTSMFNIFKEIKYKI